MAARHQVERAAVPGTLELALLLPHLTFGEGIILVAAPVADGVELIPDADQRDPAARTRRSAWPRPGGSSSVAGQGHGLEHRPRAPAGCPSQHSAGSRTSRRRSSDVAAGTGLLVDDGVEEAPAR